MTNPSGGARMETEKGGSSPVAIAIAWLAVGIPLAWGVWQTLVKSMALFK